VSVARQNNKQWHLSTDEETKGREQQQVLQHKHHGAEGEHQQSEQGKKAATTTGERKRISKFSALFLLN